MYRCEHFSIQELVPEQVYNDLGESAWALLDEDALRTLDALRGRFGAVTVNDWAWGGKFNESGLRTSECKHYKPYSMHTFGRAFDCKFKHASPVVVQRYIIRNKDEFPYIKRLENAAVTETWLHFDTGNRSDKTIYVFNP